MRASRIAILAAVALVLAALPAVAQAEQPTDPRLDFLKQLEGTWTGTFHGGEMSGERDFEFRVTAGGHAVEEREMIGTPMEMLTVYYMEGADLVGTHYCMIGNRPQVKAAAKVIDNTLSFACNGTPGGSKSHDDAHVHGWTIRLDEEGHVHYDGAFMDGGKVVEKPHTILTRKVETAAR